MIIYVVKPGDSLWLIATRYNVSRTAIINTNDLPNPDRLVIGQSLVIPTADAVHTVLPGESLWQIAQYYNTTVQAIIRANGISNPQSINPGTVLYIPATRYRVQPGDTLFSIARRYGVSVQSLMEVNGITNPNAVNVGTVLAIPHKPGPSMYVNAYTYQFGEQGVPAVREDGPYLTYFSPFAYKVREDGSLETIDDSPLISAAYAEHAVPMMSITNFTSTELGGNVAHAILSSPTVTNKLLDNVTAVMKDKGYQGLNVDFENVLPEDRELYNQFLRTTVNRMHGQGYFVSSALAPKTSATQKGPLYEAHDYPAHGRIVDFVVLMTYEWGYRLGPPQAISPLDQIRRVLDYAVSVIPRNKIYFGFQLYARDWLLPHVQGQVAETISVQDAVERAARFGTVIQYDTTAQSPFFRYTDAQGRRHEVWFEDARSAQAKFDTVKEYNLAGISYWVLGYPFPQNWVLLADNFIIRKLI